VRIGFATLGPPFCDTNFNFCDKTTKDNVLYLYFVTATFDDNKKSSASNQVKQSEAKETNNE